MKTVVLQSLDICCWLTCPPNMGTGVGRHRLMSVAVHSVTRVTSEQVNLVKCGNCTHCCLRNCQNVCVCVCNSTCVLCAQRTDLSHVWYCSALPRPYSASSAAVFEFSPVISSSLLFIPLFIPSLFCPHPPRPPYSLSPSAKYTGRFQLASAFLD